jgi:putative oxidoreductase
LCGSAMADHSALRRSGSPHPFHSTRRRFAQERHRAEAEDHRTQYRNSRGAIMASSGALPSFDRTRAVLIVSRLCLSAIFLISGAGKLMAPAATIAEIKSVGLPFPALAFGLAAAIELLCGAALLIGFKLRWTASILAVFAIATAVFFHSNFADPNQFTHFLKNIAIAGGLLHVATR